MQEQPEELEDDRQDACSGQDETRVGRLSGVARISRSYHPSRTRLVSCLRLVRVYYHRTGPASLPGVQRLTSCQNNVLSLCRPYLLRKNDTQLKDIVVIVVSISYTISPHPSCPACLQYSIRTVQEIDTVSDDLSFILCTR